MTSVDEKCCTIGGFFQFGDKIVCVYSFGLSTLHLRDYKVPDVDVVFVDVRNVQSVCKPLYHEVDADGVFEHFSVEHILYYAVRGCYTVAVYCAIVIDKRYFLEIVFRRRRQ